MRDYERLHAEALEPRRLLSVAFYGPWGYPGVGGASLSALVADMNGDGKADVVGGYRTQQGAFGLDVRLSDGDGTFTGVPAAFSGSNINVGALGDFDGDGDIDAIVGDTLALNDGAGLLTQQPPDVLLAGGGTFAALDTDGDGQAELAMKSGTTLRLLRLESGVFAQVSSIEVDGRLALDGSASVIDLTGDGRPDLVLRTDLTNPFTLLVLSGSNGLTVGPQLAGRAVLADVTQDGIADLFTFATPSSTATTIHVSAGIGDGTFGAPELRGTLPQAYDITRFLLETADINADGIPDLLYSGGQAILSDSAGRYSFGIADGRIYTFLWPYGQVSLEGAADFSGDGRLDLWTRVIRREQFTSYGVGISLQVTGATLTSFTASKTQILPQDSVVLSATAVLGDPAGSFELLIRFYIDLDGDGLRSAGDTYLGRVLNAGAGGVYRFTYDHTGTAPIGAFAFLAVAESGPTTFPPLSVPVTIVGVSLASFTVSQTQIRPLDSVVLSATVVHGDQGVGADYVQFYIDADADGQITASDTWIGRASTPDPDGVFRATYKHLGATPIGPSSLLAVATLDATTSPPLALPVTFWTRLFFPEGFRNDATVNEYLSLVNPLDRAVRYELIARYETGERDQVIATGEVGAFTRGGVTICERGVPQTGLTRPGVGYALELQTDGALGATFAHYDSTFTSAAGPRASGGAGEALTSNAATRWSYADLSTATFDFLLFYNITDQDASVSITFYDDDLGSVAYSMTIPALRRGGVALRDVGGLLPDRAYAAIVTSNVGISAAHSRYRADGRAWSALAEGIAGTHLFPGLEYRPEAVATLSLFNSSAGAVEVTITTAYDIGETRTRTTLMLPRQRRTLDPFENAPAGATVVSVRLTDNFQRILSALSVDDAARGDITSSAPAAAARTVWAFGDAFLSRDTAGTNEFESLFIYNASDAQQRVLVRFLFTDGTFTDRSLDVRARAPARLALEDESVITDHAPNTWYGIMVYGEGTVVASLTHWDLSQGGGWSTLGTPQGLVGPV